jgi:hypothetical protein
MKAILINVKTETVTEVNFSGNYKQIYDLLELHDSYGHRPFGHAYNRDNGDCLLVDDEGLLIANPIGAFTLHEYGRPLSGHGLILDQMKKERTRIAKAHWKKSKARSYFFR